MYFIITAIFAVRKIKPKPQMEIVVFMLKPVFVYRTILLQTPLCENILCPNKMTRWFLRFLNLNFFCNFIEILLTYNICMFKVHKMIWDTNCEMVTTKILVNTSIPLHNYLFVYVVRKNKNKYNKYST